jgi:hypothetical protein
MGQEKVFEANVELRWSNLVDDLNYMFFLQARQSRSSKKLYFKKTKKKKRKEKKKKVRNFRQQL